MAKLTLADSEIMSPWVIDKFRCPVGYLGDEASSVADNLSHVQHVFVTPYSPCALRTVRFFADTT